MSRMCAGMDDGLDGVGVSEPIAGEGGTGRAKGRLLRNGEVDGGEWSRRLSRLSSEGESWRRSATFMAEALMTRYGS